MIQLSTLLVDFQDDLFIVCANAHVHTRTDKQTVSSSYLSMMTGSEGVSLRLPQLFLSQHRLMEMQEPGAMRNEEEEKKRRAVNLGVTAHMSALTSNTVERREVAIIKQSFFHSSKADIHSCCTHGEQYAASQAVFQ